MEVLALCFTRPIVLGGFVSVLFRLVIAGYYGAEVPLADYVQLLQSTVNADMLRPIIQFILHQLGLLL